MFTNRILDISQALKSRWVLSKVQDIFPISNDHRHVLVLKIIREFDFGPSHLKLRSTSAVDAVTSVCVDGQSFIDQFYLLKVEPESSVSNYLYRVVKEVPLQFDAEKEFKLSMCR